MGAVFIAYSFVVFEPGSAFFEPQHYSRVCTQAMPLGVNCPNRARVTMGLRPNTLTVSQEMRWGDGCLCLDTGYRSDGMELPVISASISVVHDLPACG